MGNKQICAAIAIFLAGTLGGMAPIAAKIAFLELSPISVLFFRVTIMAATLLLFISFPWKILKTQWEKALLLGFLWTGNVTFFIIGVKYTTSAMSQVIYSLVPLFVALGDRIISGRDIRIYQYLGIGFGFAGASFLLLPPKFSPDFGMIFGNGIIICATACWAGYLLVSKKMRKDFSAFQLTLFSAAAAWFITGSIMFVTEGSKPILMALSVSRSTLIALLFLGIAVGAGMFSLINWAVKYSTPVASASMTYISTFVAAFAGAVILDEQISHRFIIGGGLLFIGLLVTSIIPLFLKDKDAAA